MAAKVQPKKPKRKPSGRPPGRPPAYKPEFVPIAAEMCLHGAINSDLAARFGVATGTIYEWANRYPEFREAIKLNKDRADDRVEAALYALAIEDKHPTALIFILKNRRRKEWQDAQVLTHEIPLASEIGKARDDIEDDL